MMILLITVGAMFAVMFQRQTLLLRKVDCIMATFQELSDTLDKIASGVNGLEAAIADLKAQVAAGHVVSQAELDALGVKAAAISADIADTSDQG